MKQEEHRSPDGVLTLVVSREDGDVTIGFAGYEWHTHGDVVGVSYRLDDVPDLNAEAAAERFVKDVLSNHAIIAMLKIGSTIRDVWVTDDIEKELRYKQADENIQFRYWDGTDIRQSSG